MSLVVLGQSQLFIVTGFELSSARFPPFATVPMQSQQQQQLKFEKVLANLPISANLSVFNLPPEQTALHLLEVNRKVNRHFAMGKGATEPLNMSRWNLVAECVDIQKMDTVFNDDGFLDEHVKIEQSPDSAEKPPAQSGSRSNTERFPVLTPDALATLGLDPASTGAFGTPYLSATGRILSPDDKPLRRSIVSVSLLSRADNYRMQLLLWSYLSAVFDMSPFIDLSDTFFAVDAYQQILILLTNGVHAARTEINQSILELGTRVCTTDTDLAKLHSDFYAFSVLHNIIHGRPPFESSSKLLLTVVDGLQRGHNISSLPRPVQTQVTKILDSFRQRLNQADSVVRPTSLSLLLAPLLKAPPTTSVSGYALMARAPAEELAPPQNSDEPLHEPVTAYMARSNMRTDPDRRPTYQDKRLALSDRDTRQDLPNRDRTSRTSTHRSDAPTEMGPSVLPDLPMEQVQQLISLLQSQVDKHTRRSKIRPSERAAAYLAAPSHIHALGARVVTDHDSDDSVEYHPGRPCRPDSDWD